MSKVNLNIQFYYAIFLIYRYIIKLFNLFKIVIYIVNLNF